MSLAFRRIYLPISLTIVLAVLVFMPATAAAHATSKRDTAGSVTGILINGSHNNAALANFPVILQAVSLGKATDAATTKTDATGHFSFSGLDTTGAIVYAVYTHFQTGLFASDAINFSSGNAQQVTLKVYDTTMSDAALRVVSTTLLFSNPDQPHGMLPIGVLMTMQNSGNTAYVASTAPANGLPMNLLRFWLPPNAQNLSLGAGFSDLQAVQVDTGFGVNATVPPGQSAYAYAYQVPYTGTQYTFQFKAEYPSDHIVALVPPAFPLVAGDFTAKPNISANGQQYQVLTRENAATNMQMSFGITRLPLPGENPDLDFGQLAIVGLTLLLALLVLLYLFLRRGNLAIVFGWIPASTLTPGRANQRLKASHEAERKRLLRSLLVLDERKASGVIGASTYARQREQLRGQLRSLLALEQSGAKARKARPVAAGQSEVLKSVAVAAPDDSTHVTNATSAAEQQAVSGGERL